MTTYECPWHAIQVERGTMCQSCLERFASLPEATTMSAEERAVELEDWIEKSLLTIPFADLQGRFEALVGRPVWTHELADPDALIREIRRGQPATFSDVLDKIPPHVKVIPVVLSDAEGTP